MNLRKTTLSTALTLSIVSLVLLSCKDNETKVKPDELLGTWTAVNEAQSKCSDSEDNYLNALACTSSTCIQYIFSKDSTGTQEYVIATTTDGLTLNEVGTFSLSGDKISFCQVNDGESECYTKSIQVNSGYLDLFEKNSDTGCIEELILQQE